MTFKPTVVLKTLEALAHELDGEPGYEEVGELVDQAVEACKEAMDPLADTSLNHHHDPVVGSKVIPHDKGPVETYPEDDDPGVEEP